MMVDNTARVLNPQPVQPETPQTTTQVSPRIQSAPKTKHVAYSPIERVLIGAIALAVTALAILCLFAQFGLSGAQRTLQDTQTKISQASTQIDTYQQSVSELTDSSRLTAFAKAHGLTVIEGSIKRAVK